MAGPRFYLGKVKSVSLMGLKFQKEQTLLSLLQWIKKHLIHLGKITSVPQAERFAMLMNSQGLLPVGTQVENVYIYVDNARMIKAISSPVDYGP